MKYPLYQTYRREGGTVTSPNDPDPSDNQNTDPNVGGTNQVPVNSGGTAPNLQTGAAPTDVATTTNPSSNTAIKIIVFIVIVAALAGGAWWAWKKL